MDSDALSTLKTLPLGWERLTCPDPFAEWDTPRDFWRELHAAALAEDGEAQEWIVFAAQELAGAQSLWDWGECWQTLEEYARELAAGSAAPQYLLDELRLAFAGVISRSHGDTQDVAGSDH